MDEKLKKNIKKFKVKFVGKHDWQKMRNLFILKLSECYTEEQFCFLLENINLRRN